MVTKALLNASIEGTGRLHKTSIFPCGIFQMMKGVNREPGDPNYDLYQLALKSTAQRLYPNYANVDWSNNAGYDRNDPCTYFSTMGCRTANLWVLLKGRSPPLPPSCGSTLFRSTTIRLCSVQLLSQPCHTKFHYHKNTLHRKRSQYSIHL